jgi:hypothetical protein
MYRKSVLMILMIFFAASSLSSVEAVADAQESPQGSSEAKVEDTVESSAEAVPMGPAPELFLPDSTHDFGKVAQSKSLTHIFKVYNKGDAPLEITKVHGS